MKKYIQIIIILLCVLQSIEAQNIENKEFVLDAAYRYTPHHQSFYSILDTLSNSFQNCIFNALDRDYFYEISIYKDSTIRGQIYPYKSYPNGINPVVFETYRNIQKANKGFLYYNEKLVLVTFRGERWAQYDTKQYFSIHNLLEVVTYSIPAESLPDAGKALDIVTLYALYDPGIGNLTITKFYGCNGSKHYIYTILESDTWETVAEKFMTTVENIQTINKTYNPTLPIIPRDDIIVNYEIVDGVLELTRIR